ncbi:hypothetical protein OHD13_16530 [Escherichia coli]|uniref:hypothetical protein n=1 Tax=Escherichia coli TaxID=562 RepID=UPI0022373E40|nr:hypothetical protein [Escherichia coli]MCW7229607.1 hypothetical protein [Escherichia coli]
MASSPSRIGMVTSGAEGGLCDPVSPADHSRPVSVPPGQRAEITATWWRTGYAVALAARLDEVWA